MATLLYSANPDEQSRLQNRSVWELARHLVGEELVVYPALIDAVMEGQEIVDRNKLKHQGVKSHLKMVQGLSSTNQ
jgi:hypothetical protein